MPIERMLHEKANSIRLRNLITIHEAGSGHIGGDFSAADILTTLYFGGILNIDPRQPRHPGRDRFIMSKGHCSGLLYTVLAFAGFFPEEELHRLFKAAGELEKPRMALQGSTLRPLLLPRSLRWRANASARTRFATIYPS